MSSKPSKQNVLGHVLDDLRGVYEREREEEGGREREREREGGRERERYKRVT